MLTLRKLGSSLLTVSMTAASNAFHLTISATERAVTYLGSLTSPRGRSVPSLCRIPVLQGDRPIFSRRRDGFTIILVPVLITMTAGLRLDTHSVVENYPD